MSVFITKSEKETLPEQLAAAAAFLEEYREDILRLDSYGGEHRRVSFCVTPEEGDSKNHAFPHEFLALAGSLRVSIDSSESVVKYY